MEQSYGGTDAPDGPATALSRRPRAFRLPSIRPACHRRERVDHLHQRRHRRAQRHQRRPRRLRRRLRLLDRRRPPSRFDGILHVVDVSGVVGGAVRAEALMLRPGRDPSHSIKPLDASLTFVKHQRPFTGRFRFFIMI